MQKPTIANWLLWSHRSLWSADGELAQWIFEIVAKASHSYCSTIREEEGAGEVTHRRVDPWKIVSEAARVAVSDAARTP